MFCPRCGSNNQDTAQFCNSCGYVLTRQGKSQGQGPGTGSKKSDTTPLYDSLIDFLSGLVSQFKEMILKSILYIIVPAVIIAIITYFGIYNYVIYLIADVADGFNKMSGCISAAGSVCNIAAFQGNDSAFMNAFGQLLVTGAFIGGLVGTIRSLGISGYISQASSLVSSLSQVFANKNQDAPPILLLGAGAGVIGGSLLSGSLFLTIPIIGLLVNSLISGTKGLLTPILQYAHRDIVRKHFGQNPPSLLDPGLISIGVLGGSIGYAIASFILANNALIGSIIGVIILAGGGYLLFGKGGPPKFAPALCIILLVLVIVPVMIQPVSAHDGGKAECGSTNWDQCAGSDGVKDAASKSAAAAAGGVAVGVVVGGVGGVAAKAADMARKRKEAQKGEENTEKDSEEEEDEGPIGYILQLTKDSLKVSVTKSDSFTATTWKVEKDGSYSHESSASIEIDVPDVAGLVVDQTSGAGTLPVTVSLSGPSDATTATLTVNASAGGKDFSATVTVTIEATMQVGFE